MHRPLISQGASCARFPLAALVCRHTLRSHPVRYRLRPSGTSPESALHRLSHSYRSTSHFLPAAVSVSPNLIQLHRLHGSGRRREFHPPAPIAAAPALLEACSYSVCSIPDWRSGVFRGGAPACPFGRVCLQLAACSVRPPRLKAHRASCRACKSPRFSPSPFPAFLNVLKPYSEKR